MGRASLAGERAVPSCLLEAISSQRWSGKCQWNSESPPPPPSLHTTLALESQRVSAGPGAEGDEDIATAYSVVMKALITKGDARAASAAFDEMLLAGYPPSYVLARIRPFFP